jgi:hypothetical protein
MMIKISLLQIARLVSKKKIEGKNDPHVFADTAFLGGCIQYLFLRLEATAASVVVIYG